jgi:Family of unknown function (DUF5681)
VATSDSGEVGYRRPPKHSRFRPGRSGNPAGRPKRSATFRNALLTELALPGKQRQRTKLEGLVRCLVDAAIAGDARAQALVVGALSRVGDSPGTETAPSTADDQAILDEYLKRRSEEQGAITPLTESNVD